MDESFDSFWEGIEEEKRVEIEEELHCINDTADQAQIGEMRRKNTG
jgi:hypothetical protein